MSDGRVLLVEDEEELPRLIAERMETWGLKARTAAQDPAALELVGRESFDGAVLDMVMPEIIAMETRRCPRKKRPNLQVIVLSAHTDLRNGIEEVKQGAAGYFEKPADMN